MTDRSLCRDESLRRAEPLIGTASTVRRWILIERPTAWKERAIDTLAAPMRRRMVDLRQRSGARILLIRRHRMRSAPGHHVYVAFTGRRRRWFEQLHVDDVAELQKMRWDDLREGRSIGGDPVPEPLFFVCTHGRRDPCCARYGRPLAGALDGRWPERTWEVSHIGGDRFAGNVLVLPHGVYYGRVPPDEAVGIMDRLVGAGEIDLRFYRGRTFLPFEAQAAEWYARRHSALLHVDEVSLEGHERGDGTTTTIFRGRGEERLVVQMRQDRHPPCRLTCHSEQTHCAPHHRLVAVHSR